MVLSLYHESPRYRNSFLSCREYLILRENLTGIAKGYPLRYILRMIKRIMSAILLATLSVASLSSVSLGTFATLESRKGGGGIELGLPLGKQPQSPFRLHCAVNVYIPDNHETQLDVLTFSVRSLFVHRHDSLHMTYGFARVEGGTVIGGSSTLFSSPHTIEVGGGAGFEYRFTDSKSWFSEFGGGTAFFFPKEAPLPESLPGSYVMLTVGLRNYL